MISLPAGKYTGETHPHTACCIFDSSMTLSTSVRSIAGNEKNDVLTGASYVWQKDFIQHTGYIFAFFQRFFQQCQAER
jgi:hypothetical protein